MPINAAHWHLVLNHIPIVGFVILFFFFLYAVVVRERHLITVGLVGLVVVAAFAIPVFYTGESAEEIVEDQPAVMERFIEDHEEAAETAYYGALLVGALALFGLGLQWRGGELPGWSLWGMVLLVLAVAASLGYTASLGGKINHPEIRTGSSPAPTEQHEGSEEPGDDHGRAPAPSRPLERAG